MTTQVSQNVQQKVEVIARHAQDTSHSATETREISLNLEQLSQQLESLLNQFTLSRKN
jgi:methyl-accepting chemotaxis protein